MVTIREFRTNDAETVKKLMDSTIDASYAGVYAPAAIAFFKTHHAIERILADGINGCTLIAEEDGRAVGTGTLAGDEVRRMFVIPDCQGQGIGREIFEQLERVARKLGLKRLTLDASLVARKFYERMGFELTEDTSRPVGNNQRLEYSVMTKVL
jgi:GNAT superfamily N-acetyltransferase